MKNWFLALALIFSSQFSYGQRDTTFWFVAPDVSAIHEDQPVRFRISTESEAARVIISQPANAGFSPVVRNLGTNSTTSYIVPPGLMSQVENSPADSILNKGFLIESDALVTVYYEVGFSNNIDIYTLKGRNALGQNFVIPGQNFWRNQLDDSYSSFDLVATENNTVIFVIPNIDINGHYQEDTVKLILQKGQSYSARALSKDPSRTLAGSIVRSSKPIAVTLTDDSIFEDGCYDLTGDQIVPVGILGNEYVVQSGNLDQNEKVFITAVYDNTEVSVNGIPLGTLQAREIQGYNITERNYFETSEPVYLMQYTGIGCEIGAALLPSINCKGSSQIAFTRSGQDFFFVNLIVKKGGEGNFRLNGSSSLIPSNAFSDVPGSNDVWVSAKIEYSTSQVTPGSANIISNTSHSFQLGFLDGGRRSGTRFGYFSNFSSLFIGDDITLCEGESRVIKPKGDPDAEYTWSDGSTGQTLTVSEAGTYWVKTINNSGCELRDTLDVSVNPSDFLELDEIVTACAGEFAILDAGNYFGFEWNNGFSSRRLTTRVPGVYTVNVRNVNGCVDEGQIEAVFVEPPMLELGEDKTICPGDSITFSSNILDAENYLWSPIDRTPHLTVKDSGTYYLIVDKGVCTVRDSISLLLHPKPEINDIIGSKSVCPGIEEVLYEVNDNSNVSYEWLVDGGAISNGEGSNSIAVDWGDTKNDAYVKLIETNEYSCAGDTNTFNVRVNVFLEAETPQGLDTLCANNTANISYNIHYTNGSSYDWKIQGGEIISGNGSNEVIVNWNGVGKHSLQVDESSATQDHVCFGSSDTKEVIVYNDSSMVNLVVTTVDQKNDNDLLISWDVYDPPNSFEELYLYKRSQGGTWELLGTPRPSSGAFLDLNLNTEKTVYEYKIEAVNSCFETVSSRIHNSLVLLGSSDEELGKINLNWNSYDGWNDGVLRYEVVRRLEISGEFEMIESVEPNQTSIEMENATDGFIHELRIRAVSMNQQTQSISNTINFEFKHEIEIPNAFSPNNDGINDTFTIPKIHLYEQSELTVFDRRGQRLFQQQRYQSDWNGGHLPSGVYYYVLQLPSINSTLKGSITILK
ncbi:MAG: gliding motility-associated C-terminal domain-containing protein [Cyclobacteriaceae bacterium]